MGANWTTNPKPGTSLGILYYPDYADAYLQNLNHGVCDAQIDLGRGVPRADLLCLCFPLKKGDITDIPGLSLFSDVVKVRYTACGGMRERSCR